MTKTISPFYKAKKLKLPSLPNTTGKSLPVLPSERLTNYIKLVDKSSLQNAFSQNYTHILSSIYHSTDKSYPYLRLSQLNIPNSLRLVLAKNHESEMQGDVSSKHYLVSSIFAEVVEIGGINSKVKICSYENTSVQKTDNKGETGHNEGETKHNKGQTEHNKGQTEHNKGQNENNKGENETPGLNRFEITDEINGQNTTENKTTDQTNTTHQSKGNSVVKVIFSSLYDKDIKFESLLFRDSRGDYILSISSQVGCSFQCGSCATGAIGFKRQLTSDEIVDQFLFFKNSGYPISKISFSAMGEPLANPNTFKALEIFTKYIGISSSKIIICTIGILPGIVRLNEFWPNVKLTLTLNSAISNKRSRLIPIESLYPLSVILPLLNERINFSRGDLWLNYLLINDFNDKVEDADAILKLIKDYFKSNSRRVMINCIGLNEWKEINEKRKTNRKRKCLSYSKTNGGKEFVFQLKSGSVKAQYFSTSFGNSVNSGFGQMTAGYSIEK